MSPSEAQDPTATLAQARAYHRAGRLLEASGGYQSVLERDPDNVEALRFLGLLLRQTGNPTRALGPLRRAARHAPRDAPVLAELGAVLMECDQGTEAEAALRRALALDPNHVPALGNLGLLLQRRGRPSEAVPLFRAAVATDPDQGPIWGQLGLALAALGEPEAARDALMEAVRADPEDVSARSNLGNALAQSGDAWAASAQFAAALRRQPRNALVHNNLGNALIMAGREQDAARHLRQALSLNPRMGGAYFNLARIGQMSLSGGDPLTARLTAMLEEPHLPDPDRLYGTYALAEIFRRADRKPETMALVRESHALKRRLRPYDRRAEFAAQPALNALLGEAFLDRARREGWGVSSDRPVFLVGMPRSGSTLAEQILASHPAVAAGGEMKTMSLLIAGLPRRLNSVTPFPAILGELDGPAIAAMASDYLDQASRAAQAPDSATRVADKMLENWRVLGLIHAVFPKARVVHCVRAPMDCLFSCYVNVFREGNLFTDDQEDLAFVYLLYRRTMEQWAALMPEAIHELRYEDLIADPEATVRALLTALDLPWDPGCLRFHETERTVTTISALQVRRPLHAGSIGRWRAWAPWLEPMINALRAGGVEVDGETT